MNIYPVEENKYQEAFSEIANIVEDEMADGYYQPRTLRDYYYSAFNTLQELIDKSIPQKVIKTTRKEYMKHGGYKHKCPNCGNMVGTITERLEIDQDDYCCSCGQRLDWRE